MEAFDTLAVAARRCGKAADRALEGEDWREDAAVGLDECEVGVEGAECVADEGACFDRAELRDGRRPTPLPPARWPRHSPSTGSSRKPRARRTTQVNTELALGRGRTAAPTRHTQNMYYCNMKVH